MKNPAFSAWNMGGACWLLLPLLLLSLIGCPSPSESPGEARVVINLGRDSGGSLKAAGAPSGISSYDILVTGAGLADTTLSYPGSTESITIELPAGPERNFEVIARIDASSSSAVLSWKGSATTDLLPGESKALAISMALNETKLVVPDKLNNRLVQIDGMSGANWKTLDAGQITYLEPFEVEDVDFDATGRIFFTNSMPGGTGWTSIFRIDNIDSTSYTSIKQDTSVALGIAIDRANNDLYYTTQTTLTKIDLDTQCGGFPCSTTALNVSGILPKAFRGIAIDGDGFLYIANGLNGVAKYNPTTQSVVVENDSVAVGSEIWDILVMNGNIYASNPGGAAGQQILQLDKNSLAVIRGYGDPVTLPDTPDTSKGKFYGPRFFVAILNKKITVVDDGDFGNNVDKLVSMTDMNGSIWQTFGSYGSGTNQFKFYYHC